ncbi:glycosyltransferase [Paenibacillus guangzhouensis]|uniref:glycosyltransferase n=1 Tax=Paenibacillus guangzhouensis TaxID=1473112 RepID=UPI0012674A22|nr:glycosyltransferase [Paenibacillus guangzhouensis]
MKTSIVIATFNKLNYNQLCIESIRKYTSHLDYEIIVVDNNSTDGTVDWLNQQEDILAVFNTENFGFPKACNQGIELATGDHILLLNNDTIVTKDWLDNMLRCLHSDESIGAVGSVTNNCANYQSISVPYNTVEEMHQFAAEFNISDPEKWEERIRLIGYNLLIKNSVISQVGLLDERFTPGNYEDDDYCLRIRLAGYKLMLCKDTFIHHFGSTSFRENVNGYLKLLNTNKQKFYEKWSIDPDGLAEINYNLVNQIKPIHPSSLRILEIGCGLGANLVEIRNRFPNAELHGEEPDVHKANVAKFVATINSNEYEKGYFDYIIISDPLEYDLMREVLHYYELLNSYGGLLIEVPNIHHFRIIDRFLRDDLGRDVARYFSYKDCDQIMNSSNWGQTSIVGVTSSISDTDKTFIEKLKHVNHHIPEKQYMIEKYLMTFKKYNLSSEIKQIVNQLIQEQDIETNTKRLLNYDHDVVLDVIVQSSTSQTVALLNYLAVLLIDRGHTKQALPYLNKAFELDEMNSSTLFNLGLVMYHLENYDLAIEWLQYIPNKDATILQLIEKLVQERELQK